MSSAFIALALQAVVSSPTPIPVPSNIVPPSETTAGAIGSDQTMYALANHQHPRITRAATVTCDASAVCNWSADWSSAPLASTPVVLPVPVNSGSMPAVCNVSTRSTTGATGKCWMSAPVTVSILGFSVNAFSGSAASLQVQVIAIPAAP